jgi:hypothetical protein
LYDSAGKLFWRGLFFHPDDFLLNLLIFFIRMPDPDDLESNLLGNFIRMKWREVALSMNSWFGVEACFQAPFLV